ncbi:hypothetical protein RHMOL_Rhmol01G0362900 [Rhododendron molle]|uniref:Uncharacterized protein n=1 Tax=Rhododendron molle TaxID=49168 RepID=A0ACC0Q9X3_RHOML|nr:hypothetical protein RHMOL_Rhmol01G0362900 [Rhododendron molle]
MAEDGVEVGVEKGSESKPQPKGSSKPKYHKPRIKPTNWGAAGSGMQAIFLDSGSRSCGTGVFLPRRSDTGFHPTKKPACSPVLLPSRVVQALNLNVHELGLQIKPPKATHQSSTQMQIASQKVSIAATQKAIKRARMDQLTAVSSHKAAVLPQRYFSQKNGLTSTFTRTVNKTRAISSGVFLLLISTYMRRS